MKTILNVLVVGLLLTLVACGTKTDAGQNESGKNNMADRSRDSSFSGSDRNKMGRPMSSAIPVEVTPITRGSISSYLLYNSTVETEELADVFSRISGLVEQIYVEEGEQVKRDQRLAQLEKDAYELDEQTAKLQFDKQTSEFNRFKALREKNLISDEEFENAHLSLRQAELQWKQAQLNLDYTIIRSPINGVVGERLVRVGDRIQPSTRLFVVANLREKVVILYVPQDELEKCRRDQTAEITTDVLPDKVFKGWVKRISPIVDPVSGTFKVTVGIKDPENLLRPGMFVSAKLIVASRRNTLLLPKPALTYESERAYFFTVQSGSVARVELKKGFEDAQKVEVLNDVPDSTQVVVVGQSGLKNGSKVQVIQSRYFAWQNISDSQKDAGTKKPLKKRQPAHRRQGKNQHN